MMNTRTKRVKAFLDATREYIEGVDTSTEVRAYTNYRFIVGVSDELDVLGVPSGLACKAAARLTVRLPDDFHIEFEEEFVELVRLWSKSIHVTYATLSEDYAESIVPDMFLAMCEQIEIVFEF